MIARSGGPPAPIPLGPQNSTDLRVHGFDVLHNDRAPRWAKGTCWPLREHIATTTTTRCHRCRRCRCSYHPRWRRRRYRCRRHYRHHSGRVHQRHRELVSAGLGHSADVCQRRRTPSPANSQVFLQVSPLPPHPSSPTVRRFVEGVVLIVDIAVVAMPANIVAAAVFVATLHVCMDHKTSQLSYT